jgi:hypothetical protein
MVPWSGHYLNTTATSSTIASLPTTDATTDSHNAPQAQLLSRIHAKGAQVVAQFSTRLCNLECVVTAFIDPYHVRPSQALSTAAHKLTGTSSNDLTINIYVPRLGSSAEIVLTQQQPYSMSLSSTTRSRVAPSSSTAISSDGSSILNLVSSAARESAVRKLLNCLELNVATETAAGKDALKLQQQQQVSPQRGRKQRDSDNKQQHLSLKIKDGISSSSTSSDGSNMKSWLTAYTVLDTTDKPTNPSERVRGQPEVMIYTYTYTHSLIILH